MWNAVNQAAAGIEKSVRSFFHKDTLKCAA
jgi:hypothetical protein